MDKHFNSLQSGKILDSQNALFIHFLLRSFFAGIAPVHCFVSILLLSRQSAHLSSYVADERKMCLKPQFLPFVYGI